MMPVRRESMELTDARLLLNRLRIAAHTDGASPKSFALLLAKVLDGRAWEEEGFPSFRTYMEAPEPAGLQMAEDQFFGAARLAGIEPVARQLLFQEEPAALAWERPTTESNKERDTHYSTESDKSDTATRVVARLKRDDPDLAEKVIRGEVTPNAAAREKGWRKPRIILSTPERVDESIRKHMPPEARRRLAELLTKED